MKRTVNVIYKALSDLKFSDHRFRSRCKTELIKILNLGSEMLMSQITYLRFEKSKIIFLVSGKRCAVQVSAYGVFFCMYFFTQTLNFRQPQMLSDCKNIIVEV